MEEFKHLRRTALGKVLGHEDAGRCNFCREVHYSPSIFRSCAQYRLEEGSKEAPAGVYFRCPLKRNGQRCNKSFAISRAGEEGFEQHYTIPDRDGHCSAELDTFEPWKEVFRNKQFRMIAESRVPSSEDKPYYRTMLEKLVESHGEELKEFESELDCVSEDENGMRYVDLESSEEDIPETWKLTNMDNDYNYDSSRAPMSFDATLSKDDEKMENGVEDKTKGIGNWSHEAVKVFYDPEGKIKKGNLEFPSDQSMLSMDEFESFMRKSWFEEGDDALKINDNRSKAHGLLEDNTSKVLFQLDDGLPVPAAEELIGETQVRAPQGVCLGDAEGRKIDFQDLPTKTGEMIPGLHFSLPRNWESSGRSVESDYTGRLIEFWVPVPSNLVTSKKQQFKRILMRDLFVLIHHTFVTLKGTRREGEHGSLQEEQTESVRKELGKEDLEALGVKIFSEAPVASIKGMKKTPVTISLTRDTAEGDSAKAVLCYFEPLIGKSSQELRSWEARISVLTVLEMLAVIQRIGLSKNGFFFPTSEKKYQLVLSGWIGENQQQQFITGKINHSCHICGARNRGNSKSILDAGELGNLPLSNVIHDVQLLKRDFKVLSPKEFELHHRFKMSSSHDMNPVFTSTLNWHTRDPFLLFPPDFTNTILGGPVKVYVELVFKLASGRSYSEIHTKMDMANRAQSRLVQGMKLYGWNRGDPTERMEMHWWPVLSEIILLLFVREHCTVHLGEEDDKYLGVDSSTMDIFIQISILQKIIYVATLRTIHSKDALKVGAMLGFIFDTLNNFIQPKICSEDRESNQTRTLKSHMIGHWFKLMSIHGPSHTFDIDNFEHNYEKRMRMQVNNQEDQTAQQFLNRTIESSSLHLLQSPTQPLKPQSVILMERDLKAFSKFTLGDMKEILGQLATSLGMEHSPNNPDIAFEGESVVFGRTVEVNSPGGSSFRLHGGSLLDSRGIAGSLPSFVKVREEVEQLPQSVFLFAGAFQLKDGKGSENRFYAILIPQSFRPGLASPVRSNIPHIREVAIDGFLEIDMSFKDAKAVLYDVEKLIPLRAYNLLPDIPDSKKLILFNSGHHDEAVDMRFNPWISEVPHLFHKSLENRAFKVWSKEFSYQILLESHCREGLFRFRRQPISKNTFPWDFVKVDIDDNIEVRFQFYASYKNEYSESLMWQSSSSTIFHESFSLNSVHLVKLEGEWTFCALQYDSQINSYFLQVISTEHSVTKTVTVHLVDSSFFEVRPDEKVVKLESLTSAQVEGLTKSKKRKLNECIPLVQNN